MRSTGPSLKRLAVDAMLLAAAMILSYIEAILPLTALTSIPGVKLGLANLAVMIAFFLFGAADAAVISAARVLLSGILFGTPISMAFAACGAAAAFAALLIYRAFLSRPLSVVGASVLSASFHTLGQLAAASVLVSDLYVFSYLPVMLVCSVVTGCFNGIVCTLLLRAARKAGKGFYA